MRIGLKVSAPEYLTAIPLAQSFPRPTISPARKRLTVVLVLTLLAIGADQLLAPITRTSAPLWATFALLLLVWRRGKSNPASGDGDPEQSLFALRLILFVVMHLGLVLVSHFLTARAEPYSGSPTVQGTIVGLGKLAVLAPTFLLLPLSSWKRFLSTYRVEACAALLVLCINVPRRILEATWPWYGQGLGWSVYMLARGLVPGLTYQGGLEPTIVGPRQDTALVLLCSGISAFELLAYVFGFVVLLDWKHLRKARALLIYLGCLFLMLVSNAFRIALLVVLGNRGFADFVMHFHVYAGSLFFCSVFLVYLSLAYKWMTQKQG
jgi:exosortase/archaeosortase family protein